MKKIVFLLLLIVWPLQVDAQFSDVPTGGELDEALTYLTELNVLGGYPDGTFRPGNPVTRAQASKMIANALQLRQPATDSIFSDLAKSNDYYQYVSALAAKQIISGYPDGSFKPYKAITRQQMAKMLANAYDLEGVFHTLPFEDVKRSVEAFQFINALYSYGVTTGTTATTYSPSKTVTRGQLAVFIYRASHMNKNGYLLAIDDSASYELARPLVKVIASGTQLHLLPLTNGNTKLYIDGTKPALYALQVKDGRISLVPESVSAGLTHNVLFYTFNALQLPFIPNQIDVQTIEGQALPANMYYAGQTATGIELAIFGPGEYRVTLSNGQQKQSYLAEVYVQNFQTFTQLYRP